MLCNAKHNENEGGTETTWHHPKKALESGTPLHLDGDLRVFSH